jgi:hypothetical protein
MKSKDIRVIKRNIYSQAVLCRVKHLDVLERKLQLSMTAARLNCSTCISMWRKLNHEQDYTVNNHQQVAFVKLHHTEFRCWSLFITMQIWAASVS